MFKIFPPTTTDLYLILLGGEYLHPFCFINGMFKIFLPTTIDLSLSLSLSSQKIMGVHLYHFFHFWMNEESFTAILINTLLYITTGVLDLYNYLKT